MLISMVTSSAEDLPRTIEFLYSKNRLNVAVSRAQYLAVIDYKDADGNISDYYPDFFVKASIKEIYIVETKGREDLDDVEKVKRLYQWCDDVNIAQSKTKFIALYIKQEDFEKYRPKNFDALAHSFRM